MFFLQECFLPQDLACPREVAGFYSIFKALGYRSATIWGYHASEVFCLSSLLLLLGAEMLARRVSQNAISECSKHPELKNDLGYLTDYLSNGLSI